MVESVALSGAPKEGSWVPGRSSQALAPEDREARLQLSNDELDV